MNKVKYSAWLKFELIEVQVPNSAERQDIQRGIQCSSPGEDKISTKKSLKWLKFSFG